MVFILCRLFHWQAAISAKPVDGGDVRSLTFSTDGKWLFTGLADHTMRVLEVSNALTALQKVTFPRAVDSVALSPDNKYVAVATDEGVKL